MLIHNILKMNYVRDGYLPNYPYHLISDEEMFNAFINDDNDSECYFDAQYPNIAPELQDAYGELRRALQWHINLYLNGGTYTVGSSDKLHTAAPGEILPPNWVYSYMLGSVVCQNSDVADRHDMLVMLNMDNIEDSITKEIGEACLSISANWVSKLSPEKSIHRPPTMFGEPHVLKSLRLLNVNLSN